MFAALYLTGCATSANLADGIRVDLSAQPDAVGVGLELDPLAAGCSFARAVSWNWAENQVCEEDE